MADYTFDGSIPEADRADLVNLGRMAPSGHNLQQWECRFSGNTMEIIERSDVTRVYMDKLGYQVAMAFGGFTHNILEYSQYIGYDSTLESISGGENEKVVVKISLKPNDNFELRREKFQNINPLRHRRSDRGKYLKADKNILSLEKLSEIVKGREINIELINDEGKIKKFSKIMGNFEKLSLMCPYSRKEILNALDSKKHKDAGLSLKSFAPDAISQRIFNFIAAHENFKFLWQIPGKVTEIKSKKLVASSTFIVGLSINGKKDIQSNFWLGYCLTKLWVYMASKGLSCCPMMSFIYIHSCPSGCGEKCGKPDFDYYKAFFDQEPEVIIRAGLSSNPQEEKKLRPLNSIAKS